MSARRAGLAAIVPAGGRARRFGSDKTLTRIDGATLLEHAVEACRGVGARPIVVVGPAANAPGGTLSAREEPAFGGPVAALAAGLARVGEADLVAVVAADTPFAADALPGLVAAARAPSETGSPTRDATASPRDGGRDGAWAVDAGGRYQPLLAVYRVASLRAALAALGDPEGAPMRALTARLDLAEVPVGSAAIDIDTPEALARVGGERS